jgi:paraquat-inducible protein A
MLIACPDCATIQEMPPPPEQGKILCRCCERVFERTAGRSLDGALACALTTLVLLVPANLLPFFTVRVAGISVTTRMGSGLATMWGQGWELLAAFCALSCMLLPFLRFGLLVTALGALRLRLDLPREWIGRLFRWAEEIDPWATSDLLLFSGALGYGRVATRIPVAIDSGAWCLIGAAVMTMLTRACLERRAIWRSIEWPPETCGEDAISCTSCDLVLPARRDGRQCPRCSARVWRRRPFAMSRCTALVLAGYALLPIANFYPASTMWEFGLAHPHTIINAIQLMFVHGYAPVAAAIFLTSFLLPIVKLAGLTWCFASIAARSHHCLRLKAKMFRAIDRVGRWSFVDPFSVFVFAPLVQFGQVAHIQVGGAVSAFIAVVVTSMFASRLFDPRLMWDAARERHSFAPSGPTEMPLLVRAAPSLERA